jgi:hypothetical protein
MNAPVILNGKIYLRELSGKLASPSLNFLFDPRMHLLESWEKKIIVVAYECECECHCRLAVFGMAVLLKN